MNEHIRKCAKDAYNQARGEHDSRMPYLTCKAGKLYLRLLRVRCKVQIGAYRKDKQMYETAVQKEQEVLAKLFAAIEEDLTCMHFEYNSDNELTVAFPHSHDFQVKGLSLIHI